MSAMISSAMDEIIKRSGDRTTERGVGQTKARGVGDQEHHVAGGFDKAQEVENVESIGDTKRKEKMDTSDDLPFSIISDMVTATKTVENEVFTVPVIVGHISHIPSNHVIFIGHKYTHFQTISYS
ncbi:Hypothetical predicted protein [Olea europaea subsp. europaea]|uniref:Uncharacterized protein n=1 Tax=Olea europaea subsp. europaea TaxID=158383 RepID=A0A8S0R3P9_OLEEU|nr:Hypothetical predicted protein [Olea europaea subsp. europaea]